MTRFLITFLILAAIVNVCIAQPKLLPKPSGDFFVGVDYLCFTDITRKELFDNNSESYREITVKSWYPVDKEPVTTAPYFYDADVIVKYFAFPKIFSEIVTNASRGTPLSIQEDKNPLVIFNHGWGEHFAQNTILMEELASNGYVVFSIAHHF